MFKKYIVYLFFVYFNLLFCVGVNYYGNLDISIIKVESCKGPKRLDCSVEEFEKTSEHSFFYKLNLKETVHVTTGKLIGKLNGQDLMRYQLRKPCEHMLIKSLLKTYFNMSESCTAVKHLYEIVVDIQEISKTYYNGMYTYGNWTFKTVLYGNNCNFICNIIQLNFTPKK